MLRILSDAEVNAADKRCGFLYASNFIIDNITAILMDQRRGDFGMCEGVARAKAHAIVECLRATGCAVPEAWSK